MTLSQDEDSCFSLLRKLISLRSTTPHEHPATSFLATHLKSLGLKTHIQPLPSDPSRTNVYAYLSSATNGDAPPKNVKVLLNSHLDTVPPHIELKEDEAKFYGRGACDAKGSVAVQVQAVKELMAEGKVKEGDVGLLYVVGEEKDHVGMRHANELNLSPSFLLVGEPTEMRLAKGHKGIIKADIQVKGKAGHSGYPERGRNAVAALVDVLARLRSTEWPVDSRLGPTTVNLATLQGGVAANVIPASAMAELSFRVSTCAADVAKQLREIVEGTPVEDGIQVVLNVLDVKEPVRCYTVPVEGVDEFVANYFTDIPYLKGSHKSLLFGPGSILVAHSDDEYVDKADLVRSVKIVKEIILKLLEECK
ncbi:hypothetical protein HK104_001791 [Borealophlyctis nickersoniae]|nr:hypothetical protein HK104_001791 [Borealophlyctis nickersoniae]